MKPREYIDQVEKENPVKDDPWEPVENYPHRGKKVSNKGPIREAAAESLLPILILRSLVYKLLELLSQNTKRILYSYGVCLSEVWFLNRLIRFDTLQYKRWINSILWNRRVKGDF